MAKITQRERDQRNLNPTPAAVIAMTIYSKLYSEQNGGSMDFWDALPGQQKVFCKDLAAAVIAAAKSGA